MILPTALINYGKTQTELINRISNYNHYGITHLLCTQNFPKNNSSYPLGIIHAKLYQGVRNVSFRPILRTY